MWLKGKALVCRQVKPFSQAADRGIAQSGSAPALGAGGRKFESCCPDHRRSLMTRMLMAARIYKPVKTAMQQGRAGTREWVLEFEPQSPQTIEPLMGWTSSGDTRSQIRMQFASLEEALAYVTRHGIPFRIYEPQKTELTPKSYAENFKFGRIDRWTH
jgi:hypothetical protein